MKLSITDQFLWDLYNELECIGDVGHFFLRRRRTMYDVFPHSENKRWIKKLSQEQFAKLIYYLKKKNYITAKNLEGKQALILTKEGINKALKASFLGEQKIKRADGKWTMLIFDIPKKEQRKRGILRSILQNLGYKMFQKSVWVTPYDVSQKTENLLQIYNLDQFVKIFLIEEL